MGAKTLAVGLLTLNGILLVLIGMSLELSDTQRPSTEPAPATASAALELPSAAPDPPPLDAYMELVERPLFWEERRPLVEEAATGTEVAASPVRLRLLGVVITPGAQQALLGLAGDPEVHRAREGDVVEGWTVSSIRPERVGLRRRGEEAELMLYPKNSAVSDDAGSERGRRRPGPR